VASSQEAERQVAILLAKRAGVLRWPEGSPRDAALKAHEDLLTEIEAARDA